MDPSMPKRKMTPGYALFFMLFWPDTWRSLIGLALAVFLGPRLIPADLRAPGSWLFFIMLATIGYSVAAYPARGISKMLKKLILGDRLKRR
jgi:hypothetical protein